MQYVIGLVFVRTWEQQGVCWCHSTKDLDVTRFPPLKMTITLRPPSPPLPSLVYWCLEDLSTLRYLECSYCCVCIHLALQNNEGHGQLHKQSAC